LPPPTTGFLGLGYPGDDPYMIPYRQTVRDFLVSTFIFISAGLHKEEINLFDNQDNQGNLLLKRVLAHGPGYFWGSSRFKSTCP
ncbi:MAG: hypothetical protein AAGH81_18235, partial [Bacteroidota bacterium]